MEEKQTSQVPPGIVYEMGPHSIKPFPLQDSEGRHKAVQQLYCHSSELTPARHDVAVQGIATHHPDLEAGATKSLNNMVLCMISEYHLTCLSQGPSYVSPVLPEAARNLLPPLEEHRAGSDFQGTQDVRVLERAKTLWVVAWLHCLDMAATGDREASYSLDQLSMAGDLCWSSSSPHEQATSHLRRLFTGSWERTGTRWRDH